MELKEEWLYIPGYEDYYQASSIGRVRSVDRYIDKGFCKNVLLGGIVLKNNIGTNGYLYVNLCIRGVVNRRSVHSLVAHTFLLNPLSKCDVNHINSNRMDNTVGNLEYSTRSENIKHGYDFGNKIAPMKGKTGKLHSKSKSVVKLSMKGNLLDEFGSQREASRVTGIDNSDIAKCCRGEQMTSGGFKWMYVEEYYKDDKP